MDSLDYNIVSELLKDASLSFVEIAKRVKTTPYTVRRRYEKLCKEGVIQKSIISIDLAKLGYQGKAYLFITTTPNANKTETINFLKHVKNVIVTTETIGPYDMVAIAPVTDLKSIQALVSEVKKAPSLHRVEIACVDDSCFPVSPNFGTILSKKSQNFTVPAKTSKT
jgi:Lrp/AsnC family transcriptional regulator, regulator for asnA, asnC and gidA